MAYVANDDDEQNQQNAAVSPSGGGSSVHLAPSAAVGSVGGGAGTSGNGQGTGGGSFATINQYLDANQGQAQPLANQITSGINQQYNTLAGQNQSVVSDLNNQVNSGYTQANPDLLAQEAANPTSFAGNASNVAGFQGQLNDKYTGPTSAESNSEFTGQQANLNNAISQGQASTQTEAGREGLLQGIEKTPTNGVTSLNSAILSQDPNAQSSIENAYTPFQNLVTGLNQSGQQIDQNIAGATKTANDTSAKANDQLQSQVTGLNNTVGGENKALTDQFNGYNTQAAAVGKQAQTANQNIQSYASNTPQLGTVNTSALNPYLSVSPLTGAAPTDATSATANDYSLQNALQTLAGSNNPLNTVINQSTANEAGTALPSNFSALQAQLAGMPAAENSVLSGIESKLSGAAAPAVSAAQNINDIKNYEATQKADEAQLAKDEQTLAKAPESYKSGSLYNAYKADQQKVAADKAAIGTAQNSTVGKNDTLAAKQADASAVGAGQWVPTAQTGFNNLLSSLGSSLAPVAVNSLPTQAQVTPNTTPSGGLFDNLANLVEVGANPMSWGANVARAATGQQLDPRDISAPGAKIVAPIAGAIVGGIYGGGPAGAAAGASAGQAVGGTLQNLGNREAHYAFGGRVLAALDKKKEDK
jgi:hypothetical protein